MNNLIQSNVQFKLTLDSLPSALVIVDQEGVIQFVNRETETLFDYSREALIGNTVEILIPINVHAQHRRDRRAFFQNPKPRSMGKGRFLHAVCKNGASFPVEVGLYPIKLDESVYVLCSVIDMTFQKELEEKLLHLTEELEITNEQLSHLAITDRLTGILNRHALLEQSIRQYKLAERANYPLSLLMVDVDYFKDVNDQHGHLVGDETLQNVAKLLSSTARTTDIVGRYGGEEFVLVLPDTDKDGALELAERCRSVIKSYPWSYRKVTVSIGISTILPSGNGREDTRLRTQEMLQEADRALYYSKENGRDQATHASDI